MELVGYKMSSRKLLKLNWTPESIPTVWGLRLYSVFLLRGDDRVSSGKKGKKGKKLKVNKEWATKKYYFRWKEKVLGQGMEFGGPGIFFYSLNFGVRPKLILAKPKEEKKKKKKKKKKKG